MKSELCHVVELGDKRQTYRKHCNIDFIPSAGMSFLIAGNVNCVEIAEYDLNNEMLLIYFEPLLAEDELEFQGFADDLVKSGFERTK